MVIERLGRTLQQVSQRAVAIANNQVDRQKVVEEWPGEIEQAARVLDELSAYLRDHKKEVEAYAAHQREDVSEWQRLADKIANIGTTIGPGGTNIWFLLQNDPVYIRQFLDNVEPLAFRNAVVDYRDNDRFDYLFEVVGELKAQ